MTISESPYYRYLKLTLIYRSKWADEWFKTLESVVHPMIDKNRKEKRVRIAILDTGVDPTHPQIQAARLTKRIADYFPRPESGTLNADAKFPDLFHDYHGHGTHGTSVLLRTAPNAAIYIAKVADNDGNLNHDDIVKVRLFILDH